MNGENDITLCPSGCAPEHTRSHDDRYFAFFSKRTCRGCFRKKMCPTKPGKRGRSLRYDDKAVRMARRRAYEDSPAFRDRYRFRAGIEGTSVSFAAYLKAAGINIIRAAVLQNREIGGDPAVTVDYSLLSCAVKGRLQRASVAIRCWSSLQWSNMYFTALFAA